jgi:hypothetical protein
VIFGVGVAATGLGLGAARLFHDDAAYTLVRRSALTFGIPAWPPFHGYWAAPVLGEAILLHGRTARPWFGELPRATERHTRAAIGPWLLALLDLVAIAALTRRIIRPLRRKTPTEVLV